MTNFVRIAGQVATPAGRRVWRGLIILLILGRLPTMASAEPPRLQVPVACNLGQDCFIQNYFDVDPGPAASDFACGSLANDGHQGTDFRVRDLIDLRRGVPVLSAASGRVLEVRDGMVDGFPNEVAPNGFEGRECGNGLVIDHGDGWTSQYCHLRQGSIRVAPGETVRAGQTVGLVGMSGDAEFPHLHLSLWHLERAIDPFLGPDATAGCRDARSPLWADEAAGRLAYQASGVINLGFAATAPSLRSVERGDHRSQLPGPHTNLWIYARIFGLQRGDRQRLRVFDPQDRLVMEDNSEPATETGTIWMHSIGRQAPAQGWPRGRYRGEFLLLRRGGVVLHADAEVELR